MFSSPTRSIRRRLVGLVTTLLLFVLVVSALGAYGEVRRSAVESAAQRLRVVAARLETTLATSVAQLQAQARAAAEHRDVQRTLVALQGAGPLAPTTRDSALAALQGPVASRASLRRVELWTVDGRRLLTSDSAARALDASDVGALFALLPASAATAIGWMRAEGDSIVYPVIGKVTADGRVVGYTVQWRSIGTSREGRQAIAELIGSDARLVFGNARNEVWTDLSERVAPPRFGDTTSIAGIRHVEIAGNSHLATVGQVPGTPWQLILAFPESEVLGRARTMLTRFALAAVLLLVVGGFGAYALSVRLTRSLGDLIGAVGAMSTGDYTRRVASHERDEVGQLATAFNEMAGRVEEAHVSLDARAQDLEVANEQLQQQAVELEAGNEQLQQQTIELETTIEQLRSTEEALAERTQVAEDALERQRTVLESIGDGFLALDAEWRITYINARYASMLGAAVEELVGRSLLAKFPAVRGSRFEREFREATQTGKARTFTTRSVVTERWLEVTAYPAPNSGVSVYARDITEQQSLEEQLRQAQKMEAVGQLAGGVAHDFNNLLTAISSFAEFAASDMPVESGARKDLDQVILATERAAALTRQLLAFSRRQVLQPRVLDLNRVVANLAPMLRRLIGEHIDFSTRLEPELPPTVADPNQTEQVLMNLVVNARDAMPDGGRLVVETGVVELDGHYVRSHDGVRPGRHVMLAVSDTGIGMSAEVRTKLFEPFFTTKRPGEGTGLGLSTVYGIVKQSGGSIFVYSEPGQGATFKVYLPIYDGPGVQREPLRAMPAIIDRAATILLVEDDALVSAATRRALEQQSYVVLMAANGEAALEILSELTEPPALVITDLVMPKMGGREVARRIREHFPSMRVLFISGYTPEAANQQGVLDADESFLDKPFTPATLARRVADMLSRPE